MINIIFSCTTFPVKNKKRFWVSENIVTHISLTRNPMSFQRTFFVKLIHQVSMSANERFSWEFKRSDRQLLKRRLIFNNCLPKFDTENLKFVLSQFVSNGTNGPTKGKFFFVLFSGGCHIEEATDYLEAIIINWTKRWRIGGQVPKN